MGAGFETTITQKEQAPRESDASSSLTQQVILPTQHLHERISLTDSTSYRPASIVPEICSDLLPSVCRIFSPQYYKETGFIVSTNGFMLATHHSVVGAGPFQVYVNQKWHGARWVDDTNCGPVIHDWGVTEDLALVKVNPFANETFTPVKFASTNFFEMTEPLVAIGFPGSTSDDKPFVSTTADLDGKLRSPTRTPAEVGPLSTWATRDSVVPSEDFNRQVIYSVIPTQHGNSGTPLATIGTHHEALVMGMVSRGMFDATYPVMVGRYTNYNVSVGTLSTPEEAMLSFLKKAGVQPDIASH